MCVGEGNERRRERERCYRADKMGCEGEQLREGDSLLWWVWRYTCVSSGVVWLRLDGERERERERAGNKIYWQ